MHTAILHVTVCVCVVHALMYVHVHIHTCIIRVCGCPYTCTKK